MTPSLEIGNGNWAVKSDSLLGYKTINGKYYPREMSVTRATTATRVNAAGLVELVPYNLVEYSEQFDNIYWAKDVGVSVNPNVANAPNGTLTADRLNLSTGGAVYRSGLPFGTGSFALSVWLKGEGSNIGKQVLLEFTNGNSIVTLTGDWQRFTTVGSNAFFVAIKRNIVGQADSVLAWGIQIVEGTLPKDYLPTTDRLDIARVDYSLGQANLLLEPQRTNLALRSEEFDNATWTKLATSVTANSTTSPSGIVNAETLTADGTLSRHYVAQSNTITSGVTYTHSIYAKKNTNNFIQLGGGFAGFGTNVWANFDLNNGVVGSIGSSTTATITNVGNGWYRCTITGTATATITGINVVYEVVSSATSIRGEINSLSTSVFLWGAQLEAGAYQTSYIPTSSTSVTRNADVISRNNIFTNGYITSAGGTWFVDFKGNVDLIRSGSAGGLFLNTGTISLAGDGFLFRNPTTSSQKMSIIKYNSGTPSTLYNTLTENVKAAIKWNGTTADIFVNGVKVVSATAFTVTNMENLIGEGQNRTLQINSMSLYPTPLSDTECINLTTI
jgi:hypothetical protein